MPEAVSKPTGSSGAPQREIPSWLAAPVRGLVGWGFYLAATLIVDVFLLFESTLDVRIYGLERLQEVKRAGETPLLVLWHGQGLLPMTAFRNERLCLYASHTREEPYSRSLRILRWWTLRLIERMGYRVVDAARFKSESRGVMQFVEVLRSGTGSVIAADGPQGPIYKAKPGPAFLAKKAGVTLVPLGAAISHGFALDQWDRFQLPWPFARAVLVVGEPRTVSAKAGDEELERARLALETEMNARAAEAERRLGLRALETAQQVEGQNAQ
ncbi:MAG TPA: DUF374 domain-containing protein [Chthonomonadaceae bacterium]|nr:DUF374 domain-containing protein [Chthonomonadaceae bacterium]